MKKYLCGVVLLLAGCASGVDPIATYNPAWCEVSEMVMEDGTHIYLYTSPQGNIAIARDKDGNMVAVGTGDHVDLALDNCLKLLREGK